ncbi:hypothetical protein SUGI_0434820 [Cryptomeria japonica]|nr:hypothetical protein SUGI_0434820 [Cryptomeria japonica]
MKRAKKQIWAAISICRRLRTCLSIEKFLQLSMHSIVSLCRRWRTGLLMEKFLQLSVHSIYCVHIQKMADWSKD